MQLLILIAIAAAAVYLFNEQEKKETPTDALPKTDVVQRRHIPSGGPRKRRNKHNGASLESTGKVLRRTITEEYIDDKETTAGSAAEPTKSQSGEAPKTET